MRRRLRVKLKKPEDEFQKQLEEELTKLSINLEALFNKGLEITDNLNAQAVTYTTNGSPDTEDAVAHALKRVPSGFFLMNTDKAVNLYDSGTAWTTTNIYLKASVASATVKVLIF